MPPLPPPPPEVPERPPPARLHGERAVLFPNVAGDGVLSGRLAARDPLRAVLVCAPHPLYGGTMDNAVVAALCKLAGERGRSTLRFDYRGVQQSTGRYDDGRGEVDDVRAALAFLRRELPGAAVDVVGYSFGSYVGLAAMAGDPSVRATALLSPVPALFDYAAAASVPHAPLAVLLGDRDDYTPEPDGRALAARLSAPFVLLPESDHFFTRGRRALAQTVLDQLDRLPDLAAQAAPGAAG